MLWAMTEAAAKLTRVKEYFILKVVWVNVNRWSGIGVVVG